MDEVVAQQSKPAVLFVEEDLLIARLQGGMDLDLAKRFVDEFHQLHSRYGRYFLLIDLSHAGVMLPEVRRLLAEYQAACPPAAVAVFGGGASNRGMNAMFQGAIVAVGGQRRADPLFATESEARAWLTTERQRLT